MFTIEMLPGGPGDCLWIEYGLKSKPRRILVDGGAHSKELRTRIGALGPNARFELLVITHVDDDHIGGILEMFNDKKIAPTFGDIWYNGREDHTGAAGPVSLKQGDSLTKILLKGQLPWNAAFGGRGIAVPATGALPVRKFGSMRVTVVSPGAAQLKALRDDWPAAVAGTKLAVPGTPPPAPIGIAALRPCPATVLPGQLASLAAQQVIEDPSPTNASSIGLLLEFGGRRLLLGADARADVLTASVDRLCTLLGERPLRLAAYKVAHHGSENNTSLGLLDLIDCPEFLISTNGTKGYCHPHEQTIARIARKKPGAVIYFNSLSKANRIWKDPALVAAGGYTPSYPADRPDGRIDLPA